MSLNRNLAVRIDGTPAAEGCRVRLQGEITLSLYPDLLTLTVWNLSDEGYHQLRRGGSVSVSCGPSLLASGIIRDVARETLPDGVRTLIGFSLGLDLWESAVSLTVPAGAAASRTVTLLLEASGTPWKLLSFPGPDPVFPRAQSHFGHTPDRIAAVLSAARARACLTPSGLIVVPETPESPEAFLSESDLTDAPVYTADCAVLSTKMAGWPIGRRLRLNDRGKTTDGIITRQRFDADTGDGPWQTQIIAEVLHG